MPTKQPNALTIAINTETPGKPVAWVSVLRFANSRAMNFDAKAHPLSAECRTYSELKAAVDVLRQDLDDILRSGKAQLPA